jgi:hypothetical protein
MPPKFLMHIEKKYGFLSLNLEFMKSTLLRIFLFLLGNTLLLFIHFSLFNKQPVYGFITASIHIILLIVFPYSRFFKTR